MLEFASQQESAMIISGDDNRLSNNYYAPSFLFMPLGIMLL